MSRVPKRGPGRASTIVCNHFGWIEIIALVQSYLHPSFAAKAEYMDTVLIGDLARGVESLFINRIGSESNRNQIVE